MTSSGPRATRWDADTFYWGNECPLSHETSPGVLTINPTASNCTEMAALLDGVSRTALPVAYMFSSTFGQQYGGKIVFYEGRRLDGRSLPRPWLVQEHEPGLHDGGGLPPDLGFWRTGRHWSHRWWPVVRVVAQQALEAGHVGARVVCYEQHGPVEAVTRVPGVRTRRRGVCCHSAGIRQLRHSAFRRADSGAGVQQGGRRNMGRLVGGAYANDQIWASDVVPSLASGGTQAAGLGIFAGDAANLARSDGFQVHSLNDGTPVATVPRRAHERSPGRSLRR